MLLNYQSFLRHSILIVQFFSHVSYYCGQMLTVHGLNYLLKNGVKIVKPGELALQPGELALQPGTRDKWLSPVIQAIWEARTEGWLDVEWLLPPADWILWPH